jgi:hypothetical protein
MAHEPTSERERFWSKVDWSGGHEACWPWMAGIDKDGYGKFQTGTHRNQRHWRSHRYVAEMMGMVAPVIMHTCDNPPCCNPDHLRAGTQRDNRDDCIKKGRTARAERHGHAVITAATARSVKDLLAAGCQKAAIARHLGLPRHIVYNIANGSWRSA